MDKHVYASPSGSGEIPYRWSVAWTDGSGRQPTTRHLTVAVDPLQGADGDSPDGRRSEATAGGLPVGVARVRAYVSAPRGCASASCISCPSSRWVRREVARHLNAIELRGISRSFTINDTRLTVLDGVDLRVGEREVVAIVGPNGSGKSTLLRVMSGLLAADRGTVLVFDSTVAGVEPRIGMVFQEPRLLPWRNVLANVAFPLELAGEARAPREARARQVLALTGMEGFEAAYPDQLSGGMAQRAALARALAPEPDVLLLDEPFSALDAMTRERLDGELLTLWGATGTTIVIVTHSIAEAVFLADRVLVMSPRPGRIVAEVSVDAARPRSLSGPDAPSFGEAADAVRRALALEGVDGVGVAA